MKESLLIFEQLLSRRGIADCFLLVAEISQDNGDGEIAARLFGAAEMLLDSRGAQVAIPQRDYYERTILAPARNQLDKHVWAEGRELSLESAMALAVEYAPERPLEARLPVG